MRRSAKDAGILISPETSAGPILAEPPCHRTGTLRSLSPNRKRLTPKTRLTCGLDVAVTPVFYSDLGRHLLGELRELLSLCGHCLELLARMRGRQLDKLRRGLRTQLLMGVVKGGASR